VEGAAEQSHVQRCVRIDVEVDHDGVPLGGRLIVAVTP
jgi:hypothetical protein